MTQESSVQTVRECLAHAGREGLRIGSPQLAGGLSLFPLFYDRPSVAYVTLLEAQKAETITVRELDAGGHVPTLVVENRGVQPVLIVDGDLLIGLKQDRVVNTTIVVPGKSTLNIPVSCVESGRWRPRTRAARLANFSISPGVRAAMRKSGIMKLRSQGTLGADQGEVWGKVGEYLSAHRVSSRTQAFLEIEQKRRPEVEEQLAQLRPADGQAGVVAAVGECLLSFDLFDKPQTLQTAWRGLIGSFVMESMAGNRDSDQTASPKEHGAPDVEAATAWVRELASGDASVHDAVGLGSTVTISGKNQDLTALLVEDVPVHVAANRRE